MKFPIPIQIQIQIQIYVRVYVVCTYLHTLMVCSTGQLVDNIRMFFNRECISIYEYMYTYIILYIIICTIHNKLIPVKI